MTDTVNIRFVNEPPAKGRKVNIMSGATSEQLMLDMGTMVTLVPGQGKCIDDMLHDIEAKPAMASLVIPDNRSYSDTAGYWQAWRTSTIDSLGRVYSNICRFRFQQFVAEGTDAEDEANTREINLLKDGANRFQGHHRIWEEHRRFVDDNITRLRTQAHVVNVKRAALKQNLRDRISALARQNDQKSIHLTRMLVNTSDAMEQTVEERRRLHVQRYQADCANSFDRLQSMVKSLDYFDRAFGRDLTTLYDHIQEVYRTIDASVRQKMHDNQQLCHQLQARWVQQVYAPLSQLMGGIKSTDALTMAMQALTDENDPYCLRRCEMVVLELGRERERLLSVRQDAPHPTPTDEFDDDIMREAREVREKDRKATDLAHAERLKSLKATIADKSKMIGSITQRVQLLKTQAEFIRQNSQHVWVQASGMPAKKVAALVRACDEKQRHIAQELGQREMDLSDLQHEIKAIKNNLTATDRLYEVDMALAVVNVACDGFRRLYESFQSATSTEAAMKIMLRAHQIDEGRALFTANMSIIGKTIDLCRAAFAQTGVTLAQYEDHIQEASRRVNALDQARIEQESRVTGPEIGAFASLEEYVATSKDAHNLLDQIERLQGMIPICEHARDLSLQMHQRLIEFITK